MSMVTQYGFNWGPIVVERLAHVEGRGYALTVKTKYAETQIYVSEKGRVVKPYSPRKLDGSKEQ